MSIETIEGTIEEIIYKNEENGYTVCVLNNSKYKVTCVGVMQNIGIGEFIQANGQYVSHHVYGEQFNIESYHASIPTNAQAIEKYLSSGAIKGIGPSLAKKIVKRFKEDTISVIEEQPELLIDIKGNSERKAQEIASTFIEQKAMRNTTLFLQDYGITLTYAIKIYNQYKERSIAIVQNNPYRLAEDIYGIGFKMADTIAEKIGIDKISMHRIKAGIKYILGQASQDGHTCLPRYMLYQRSIQLLEAPEELIENALLELQMDKQVFTQQIDEIDFVYLITYYYMELSVARKLYDLSDTNQEQPPSIDKDIQRIEKERNMQLDIKQKTAVKQAVWQGVTIITGGPGTGKTTTINTIIELLEEQNMEVLLAAPTGRAAKRMTEATGKDAQTIHRLLEISYLKENQAHQSFEKNEDNPLECDAVIVDEVSMVDITLMNSLLKAIVPGTKVIFVGDKDQLPSVGPGNVLKDMIGCGKIPTVKLEKIFRQAKESLIITNAHKINIGKPIELCNKSTDFFYIRKADAKTIIQELITLTKTRLPKFAKCSSVEGIQVLSPMRKGMLGVDNMNQELQQALNPPHKDKNEKEYRHTVFREGDKVMQIKNNYNIPWEIKNKYNYTKDEGLGVFNGDVGIIKSINLYTEKVEVKYEVQKLVTYDFTNLDELELAYAVTIHKSQGSEYPVVIIPLLTGPSMLMNRNLLYTAVTRAKKYVVIVGLESTIMQMIQNDKEISRYSTLDYRLEEIYGIMELAQV